MRFNAVPRPGWPVRVAGMPARSFRAGDMFALSGVIAPESADIYERRPFCSDACSGVRYRRTGEVGTNQAHCDGVRSAGATRRKLRLFRYAYRTLWIIRVFRYAIAAWPR